MYKYVFFILFSSRNGVCLVIAIRHLNAKYLFTFISFGAVHYENGGNFFQFLIFFWCLFLLLLPYSSSNSIVMKEFGVFELYTSVYGMDDCNKNANFLVCFLICVSHPKKKTRTKYEEAFK